jgi:hypothetical protein
MGYAGEAALALRDLAFADLKLPTLVSYVDPHKRGCIAVAERLGAQRADMAPRQDPEDVVFRHGPRAPCNFVLSRKPHAPKGAPRQPCSAREKGLAPDPLRPAGLPTR